MGAEGDHLTFEPPRHASGLCIRYNAEITDLDIIMENLVKTQKVYLVKKRNPSVRV